MFFLEEGKMSVSIQIFSINLGIFHLLQNLGFGKILYTSEKMSTNRAENIFSKYLLHYVHEIAQKYSREKKYLSSFYDIVAGSSVRPSHGKAYRCPVYARVCRRRYSKTSIISVKRKLVFEA
jgi:hypothetical protein